MEGSLVDPASGWTTYFRYRVCFVFFILLLGSRLRGLVSFADCSGGEGSLGVIIVAGTSSQLLDKLVDWG